MLKQFRQTGGNAAQVIGEALFLACAGVILQTQQV